MERLVITRKTRGAAPVVKYIGGDADKANKALADAAKLKDIPEVIELYLLQRPHKRIDTTPASEEELAIAKKRDEEEAKRQKALKAESKAKDSSKSKEGQS